MREELLNKLKEEFESDKYKYMSDKQKTAMLMMEYLTSIREEDTNKLYIYCGATTNTGYNEHFVDKNNSDARNLLYWDIEQTYMISVPKENYKKFEKNNIILNGRHDDIALDFFLEAIKSNQKNAVKKITKKYKK